MPVYVDKPIHEFKGMIMCHMIADTLEELHEMADKIGIKREWFQKNASFPHYDIPKMRREKAVKLGAIEVNRRELVYKMREIRKKGNA